MNKFAVLLTRERAKMAMNEWENYHSDIFRALCSVYKKLGQFFFRNYSSTRLNNKKLVDTPVLLRVINI